MATWAAQFRGRPVDGILFYGQSNAGAGGDAPPLLLTPSPPNIMSFAGRRQFSGNIPVDTNALNTFGAVSDAASNPPLPATAMADALAELTTDIRPAPLFFFNTVWYGSQPITAFFPNTISWDNLTDVARRMVQLVHAANGIPTISAVVFIQGESGPSDREQYGEELVSLLADLGPALRQQTGQSRTPLMLLTQTNAGAIAAPTPSEVDLAQWDVAQRSQGSAVLVGPMYQLPLKGNIHETAEGRMMLGELLALVYRQVAMDRQHFLPLHPVSASRHQTGITVLFQRPIGTNGIAWDTSWIAPSPNYGFAMRDTAGDLPIASVHIVGKDSIHIAWSRPPVSQTLDLLYARTQPSVPGWASGRGQLMAETSIASPFAGKGFHIPKLLRHYCLRFKLEVS